MKLLGSGSFGKVYKVCKKQKCEILKVLENSNDARDEVRALEHVRDVVANTQYQNFVMLIQSHKPYEIRARYDENYGNIEDVIDKKVWSMEDSIIFFIELFSTLHFLHEHKILHMDIALANILVGPPKFFTIQKKTLKGLYSPIVIDFGLSEIVGNVSETSPFDTKCLKPIYDVYTLLFDFKTNLFKKQVHLRSLVDDIIAYIFGSQFDALIKVTSMNSFQLSKLGCEIVGHNKFKFKDILQSPLIRNYLS
jgi:serine/threonine protein kinase